MASHKKQRYDTVNRYTIRKDSTLKRPVSRHFLKGELVTPKNLLVLSSPIASKHSAFPLTEVSASKVPAILKKFVSKEATSEAAIFKLSWQPGHVYVTSFRPT